MTSELDSSLQVWLDANDKAVDAAAKYMTKKGGFNPPLEKPWNEWEALRKVADEAWYKYQAARRNQFSSVWFHK